MAATIKDVARYCGLSTATVSKYINGIHVRADNQARIEEAIAALGFRVNAIARGLKTNRTMTVGVLVPYVNRQFFSDIFRYLEETLHVHGYSAILCSYSEDPALEVEKLRALLGKGVDGLVVIPRELTGERLRQLGVGDLPVVAIDRPMEGARVDSVLVDNREIARQAMGLLLDAGHRRVGVLSGPQDLYSTQQRVLGIRDALREHDAREEDVAWLMGDSSLETAYALAAELLDRRPRPTAILCINYENTRTALWEILNGHNLAVPEDVSFVGFDLLELAQLLRPRITMVEQPLEEIGRTAARLLLERMAAPEEERPPRQVQLSCTLHRLESVACLT